MTERKIDKEFKVGDKRCGGTITEIHIESGNNYAVIVCDRCGRERHKLYNDLLKDRPCKCATSTGRIKTLLVADDGTEYERVEDVPIGTHLGGRELVAKERAIGEYKAFLKCPHCGVVVKTVKLRIVRGMVCNCRALEKNKKTNLEKYGVEFPTQSQEIKDKTVENSLRKHGARSPNMLEAKKNKTKQTMLDRYGYEYGMQVPEIRERAVQTCIEKFGGPTAMASPEVVEKCLLTRANNDKANMFRSKAELEIEEFIKSLGLEAKHHGSGKYELDILVPELGIGIEYNGCYYHRELKDGVQPDKRRGNGKPRRYHVDKTEHYATIGIDVIHIWDTTWRDRKQQVKNFLVSKLGKSENRIGVRKCNVTVIDSETARAFIAENHIQGSKINVLYAVGAYCNEDLIAVAAFSKHHRGNDAITLSRLCTKYNWTCSGFLSKATKMASEEFDSPIYTWVDRTLSTGKSYLSAGFVVDGVLDIDYFYYSDRSRKTIGKQSFRKIDGRTEYQRATDEGLVRVWDCGKIRLVYNKKPTK